MELYWRHLSIHSQQSMWMHRKYLLGFRGKYRSSFHSRNDLLCHPTIYRHYTDFRNRRWSCENDNEKLIRFNIFTLSSSFFDLETTKINFTLTCWLWMLIWFFPNQDIHCYCVSHFCRRMSMWFRDQLQLKVNFCCFITQLVFCQRFFVFMFGFELTQCDVTLANTLNW